ncbi:MAG: hypothetical protein C7B43_08905 [Sulfobacillus benefaciens]|uniref:Transposase n=1 Tax=Sulfobacillus benefaciens TaxID=453960 RepID=A0A2T2X3T2_9FIRM|nr:MAG: hypothetical protein C7B43_08905 [Sulfobacillus benefaciens]
MSQTYSAQFKQQGAQEDAPNATLVARRHQISPSMMRQVEPASVTRGRTPAVLSETASQRDSPRSEGWR